MLVRVACCAAAALAVGSVAAPAQAAPGVFAHRGGPYVRGKPIFPENTLPGFGLAALQGDPLEFDVKLTADRVPVVIHDATLDRTTNCTGRVADKTLAQLRKCRANVLGVPGSDLPTRGVADPSARVPPGRPGGGPPRGGPPRRSPTCSRSPAVRGRRSCPRSRTTRPIPTTT